jgi:3-oxoacyl-[acyl-carrier protein] reductase
MRNTANVLSPGAVATEGSAAFFPAAFMQPLVESIPLGRMARPEDIASVIAFFASDESGFMTGTCMPVTAGAGIGRANAARSTPIPFSAQETKE